jgi:hypothetical protein
MKADIDSVTGADHYPLPLPHCQSGSDSGSDAMKERGLRSFMTSRESCSGVLTFDDEGGPL